MIRRLETAAAMLVFVSTIVPAAACTNISLVTSGGDVIRVTILSQAAPKLDTTDAMVLEAFHIMNQFAIPPGVVPPNTNTPTTEKDETEHTQ